jgi:hypothetical protein
VVAKGKERAGAGRERSSEPSAAMACGGAASAARERAERRERAVEGANGSGGFGGRVQGLLVADQGVSTPSHARHAAARLCRRATAARRGRPRARTRARARGGGRGRRGRARPASASGPEARPRPASAPFPFSIIFFSFFSQILFQKHFDHFQIIFTIFTQKQSGAKLKALQLCFNR